MIEQPPSEPSAQPSSPAQPVAVAEPAQAKLGKARLWLRLLFWLVLLLFVGAGAISYEAYRFLTNPASATAEEKLFAVPPGASFVRVAKSLEAAGLIQNAQYFRLLGYATKNLGSVRAGEYAISTSWTPEQVLYQITQGQPVLHWLSLREGLPWWEVAKSIEDQGFARFDDLKELFHSLEFLQTQGIPFASAEGFLYPETYLLRKPKQLDAAAARAVTTMLIRMFWNKTEHVWTQLPVKPGGEILLRKQGIKTGVEPAINPVPVEGNSTTAIANTLATGDTVQNMPAANALAQPTANATAAQPNLIDKASVITPTGPEQNTIQAGLPGPATPLDIAPAALHRLVILASLVEKETAVPAERPRVAGVYSNRLRLTMLLQCDPTIIYGVGPSFSGAIKRSQLQDVANKYNTYIHPGLPPGPICSPGAASLQAAFSPEQHDYLYFVATGMGKDHTFSKNLEEHNKAVQVYRRATRGQ